MANYDYDIGVLGAGAAGLTVTAGAAMAGAKVLVVEKEHRLGGDCLYFGCVPSKTLIRTAKIYHFMKNSGQFGLPGVNPERPDFRKVAERIDSVIGTIQAHDSEERFCGLGAKVEYGQPAFVDDHSISLDGKRISAGHWVVATGSSPAIPPVQGLKETSYITNKEVFSMSELPESMIIIGGGPIGIELAQAFARLGTKVTVVEFLSRILNADDSDLTDIVMDVLKGEGVEFYLDSAVVSTRNVGDEKEVTFKKGDETKSVRARTLLVATGRRVNLDGLSLEQAGVAFERRGLILDKRLRTTQKHIFGAGDVTGAYQFTHAAGYEGGIALSNAIFHLPRKADYRYFPWVTYTEPELSSIGMNEKTAKSKGIHIRSGPKNSP